MNFFSPSRLLPRLGARGAILMLLMGVVLAGCSKPTPPSVKIYPVLVTTVRNAGGQTDRTYTAAIRARYETDIGFRTGGKIIQRMVDVGDVVKAGQPLAKLDLADYALAVASATATLNAEKADSDQAASDEARFRRLVSDGSLGVADHERQKSRAAAMAARYMQAKAQLSIAENRQAYATLVAPYGGVVTSLRMESGQVVTEGQPVISMARQGELEVVVDLPEHVAGEVRSSTARAQLWGRDDIQLKLKLRELSPLAALQSRTFRARFSILDADKKVFDSLRLGMTAELVLLGAPGSASATLPASALFTASSKPGVWLVNQDGTLTYTPVEILSFTQETVSVAGLQDGARVVSAGVQKLDPSMKVVASERTASGTNFEPPKGKKLVASDYKERQ
jgi:RND family efflux transporter MFP subunit